jgi:hypothetical protein
MTLKLHLSIDFLHKLYDDVFKINDEVCGYLKLSDDKLTMYNKKKGERDENGRGSCLPEKIVGSQTDYIFHTHPENSYAYPSFEDLWYVMKRRNVYSFIITIWGLFVVVPRGTVAIDDDKTRNNYEKIFKYNITEFHKNTKMGSHVSKNYYYSILEIIHFINIVNKLFGTTALEPRPASQWVRNVSRRFNVPYYVNTETGAKSWSKPVVDATGEKRRSRSRSPDRNPRSKSRSRSNNHQIDSLGCHLYMYLYSWKDIADEKEKRKEFIEIET